MCNALSHEQIQFTAMAMKRTGSEIDVANFGCLDGSPVPAIGFDEAPRTP